MAVAVAVSTEVVPACSHAVACDAYALHAEFTAAASDEHALVPADWAHAWAVLWLHCAHASFTQ